MRWLPDGRLITPEVAKASIYLYVDTTRSYPWLRLGDLKPEAATRLDFVIQALLDVAQTSAGDWAGHRAAAAAAGEEFPAYASAWLWGLAMHRRHVWKECALELGAIQGFEPSPLHSPPVRFEEGESFEEPGPQPYGIDPDEAPRLVRDWMRHCDVTDAEVDETMSDELVPHWVVSEHYVAGVIGDFRRVRRGAVRRVLEQARWKNRMPLLFVNGFYTERAQAFAARNHVALFVYDEYEGMLLGWNDLGRRFQRAEIGLHRAIRDLLSARSLAKLGWDEWSERPQSLGGQLVASVQYADQKQRLTRHTLENWKVEFLVDILNARGGVMRSEALTSIMGSLATFNSTIAALRRVLNVDGYETISMSSDGASIVLDPALLREQFKL